MGRGAHVGVHEWSTKFGYAAIALLRNYIRDGPRLVR